MSEVNFNRLVIENFLGIANGDVSLRERGLLSVSGNNVDDSSAVSNGSGKSSLADAIAWVIYGLTARGETGDKVVNRVVGKNCVVRLDIDVDGVPYTIKRYRKHSKFKNRILVERDGLDITLGTDKMTQELIERLLGATYEVFVASVYAGQEQMPDLPSMTDRELKILVEKAAGVDHLDAAYKIALEKVSETSNLFKNAEARRCNLLSEFQKVEALLNMAVDNEANWNLENENEILEIKSRIAKLKDIAQTGFGSGSFKVIRSNLEDLISAANDRVVMLNSLWSAKTAELNALTLNIGEPPDKVSLTDTVSENIDKLNLEMENAKRNEIALTAKTSNLASEGLRISAQISNLQNAATESGFRCPTCHAQHDTLPESVVADIAKLNTLLVNTKSDLEKANKVKAQNDELISSLTLQIADLSATRDNLRNEERKLNDLNIANWKLKTKELMDKKEKLTLESRDIRVKLDSANDVLLEAKTKLETFEKLSDRLKSLTDEWQKIKGKKSPFTEKIIEIELKKENLETLIVEADCALNETKLDFERAQKVAHMFSPKGIRGELLDQVTPYLNARTSIHLAQLSDGQIDAEWETLGETSSGEVREKFHINVTHKSGANTFAGLSGGEKRKVRIACAMALQDLISTRATKAIKLWIGDEIDDAIDAAGLERLMVLLEQKAKEVGTVLIISHNDIRDYVRNEIIVEKKGALGYVRN